MNCLPAGVCCSSMSRWWWLLFVFERVLARHIEKIVWIVLAVCLLVWGMVVFIPLSVRYSYVFLLIRVFFQSGSGYALAGIWGFFVCHIRLHSNSGLSVCGPQGEPPGWCRAQGAGRVRVFGSGLCQCRRHLFRWSCCMVSPVTVFSLRALPLLAVITLPF